MKAQLYLQTFRLTFFKSSLDLVTYLLPVPSGPISYRIKCKPLSLASRPLKLCPCPPLQLHFSLFPTLIHPMC